MVCADLVTAGELEAVFGPTNYQPRTNWLPSLSPVKYAVQNTGGVSCTWGNDDVPVGGVANRAYQELTVQVLPDANAAQLERHTGDDPLDDSPAFGDTSSTRCVGSIRLCTSNIVVGDAWIDVFVDGVAVAEPAADADVTAIVAPVLTAITSRMSVAANNVAPTAAIDARTDCDVILPAETVQSVFEAAELPGYSIYNGGGWSVMTGAATLAGVTRCMVGPSGSDAMLANLEMLPHGAWALSAAEVERGVWDNHEAVSVAGVTEQSYLVCPVGAISACSVDFVVGDAWVRLGTFIDGQNPVSAPDPGKVLELAGYVASTLK